MEVRELRIGNWVNCLLLGNYRLCSGDIETDKAKEIYKPIPLTPDILIKAGFVNVRDNHWCVPSSKASNSFEVCLWPDHVSYTKGNNHHVKINYLHQLQNLYYSLTQQELKINL